MFLGIPAQCFFSPLWQVSNLKGDQKKESFSPFTSSLGIKWRVLLGKTRKMGIGLATFKVITGATYQRTPLFKNKANPEDQTFYVLGPHSLTTSILCLSSMSQVLFYTGQKMTGVDWLGTTKFGNWKHRPTFLKIDLHFQYFLWKIIFFLIVLQQSLKFLYALWRCWEQE